MKFVVLLVVMLSFSFICFCSNAGEKPTEIDYNTFSIVKSKAFKLSDVVDIKRIVKLETTDKSLFAQVSSLKTDNQGNIFIADKRSAQKVFCFDKNGKFLRSFGKRGAGPGEVHQIQGFGLMSNGDVVIVSDLKLIKFDKNGLLKREIRVKPVYEDIAVVNDRIYLSPVRYRNPRKGQKGLLIFDEEFNELGGISRHDERLNKYLFLPNNVFAQRPNTLYFLNYYDLTLNIFDVESGAHRFVRFPSNNDKLKGVWNKIRMTDRDMTRVRKMIHRFEKITAVGDLLVLAESCNEKDIFDYWILDSGTRKAVVYPYNQMTGVQKYFFFKISGSLGEEGIVVLDTADEKKFNMLNSEFSVLKDLAFDMEANPVLAIFEFKKLN